MPAGAAKGERRGGRVAGVPNKTTRQRKLLEAQALEAETVMARARRSPVPVRKLAVQVLDDFMQVFAGMAAEVQPSPRTAARQNPNGNKDEFERWARLAMEAGRYLAKFQSPQARVHFMGTPGMPDMGGSGSGAPAGAAGPLIEGEATASNVVSINDTDALARVYRNLINATRRG